jgi:hypothetical protein
MKRSEFSRAADLAPAAKAVAKLSNRAVDAGDHGRHRVPKKTGDVEQWRWRLCCAIVIRRRFSSIRRAKHDGRAWLSTDRCCVHSGSARPIGGASIPRSSRARGLLGVRTSSTITATIWMGRLGRMEGVVRYDHGFK